MTRIGLISDTRGLLRPEAKLFLRGCGSSGPRRFKLPIAVAELVVVGKSITPRIVELSKEHAA